MADALQAPSKFETTMGPVLALAGAGLLVYSVGLVVIHALGWLRLGYWPTFSTAELFVVLGWNYPSQDMVGLQRIIDYVMQCGAASCAAALGVVLVYCGGYLIGVSEEKTRAYTQKKMLAQRRAEFNSQSAK